MALSLLPAACGGGGGFEPTPVPTPASSPTPGPLWSEVTPLRDAAAQAGRLVGAAVLSSRLGSDATYSGAAGRHFNYLTSEYEMKWDPIQRTPGVYDFSGGDAIVAFAESRGMKVKGHALVWHQALPSWVASLLPPELRIAFEDHIRTVAGHYRRRVHASVQRRVVFLFFTGDPGQRTHGIRVLGVDLDGLAKGSLRTGKIGIPGADDSHRRVSRGQSVVQGKRPVEQRRGLRRHLGARQAAVLGPEHECVCESDVSGRKVGIEPDGFPEVVGRLANPLGRPGNHPMLADQIGLVGLQAVGRHPREVLPLLRRQGGLHGPRDRNGDIALYLKQAVRRDFPVIPFGPDVLIGRSVDQLNVDPDSIASPLYRTLQDPTHAEFSADLTQALVAASIAGCRGPGDDFQAADPEDTFARLAAGALTMTFLIYIFINIGMVSGLLPVVGVPLPLISYGSSSMVTLLASFGILMSVDTHRRLLRT